MTSFFTWFKKNRRAQSRGDNARSKNRLHKRSLRLESLESRELLAVWYVNDIGDTNWVDTSNNTGDLRGILTSPNLANGDVIQFSASVFTADNHTITLNTPVGAGNSIAITKSLTIQNTLSGFKVNITTSEPMTNRSSLFVVNDYNPETTQTVELQALEISNFNGGAIVNSESLRITDSSFHDNYANGASGGAILNLPAAATTVSSYTNVSFASNGASRHGGAIFCGENVKLNLENCTFEGNYTGRGIITQTVAGGGLVADGPDWYQLTAYTAPESGDAGAVYHYGTYADGVYAVDTTGNGGAIANAGALTITDGSFTKNVAQYGGAIMSVGTTIIHGGVTFEKNVAGANGGAISSSGSGTLSINYQFETENDAVFDGNIAVGAEDDATGFGGAIYCYGINSGIANSNVIFNALFTNNVARMDGGALCVNGELYEVLGRTGNGGSAQLQNVIFGGSEGEGNVAQHGGALINLATATLQDGVVVSYNEAKVNGGGISSTGAGSTIIFDAASSANAVRVQNNSAYFWAGGLLILDKPFNVSNKSDSSETVNALTVSDNTITGPATNERVHTNTSNAYFNASCGFLDSEIGGGIPTMTVGTTNPIVYSAENPLEGSPSEPVVVANSSTLVATGALRNIDVQQGNAAVLEPTGLDAATMTYGYDFDGDGIDDLTTGSVLTAKELGDQVGSRSVVLSIYENGILFDKMNVVISVSAKPIAVEVKAESLGDGQIARLNFNVGVSSAPVAKWVVNWGDGTETVSDKLSSSATFAHSYATGSQATEFTPTLTVVDVDGVQSETFDVASFVVPASVLETEADEITLVASAAILENESERLDASSKNLNVKKAFDQNARRTFFAETAASSFAPTAAKELANDASDELWSADFDESALFVVAESRRERRQRSQADANDALSDSLDVDWDVE